MALKLGQIWMPQYKSQLEATEGLAVGYGLIMAGDAKPQGQAPDAPPEARAPIITK
jgi:hypothetical protein